VKNEITERKFRKFIYHGNLSKPKTKIAKHFGIHVATLRRWMRMNGYGYFIDSTKGFNPKPITWICKTCGSTLKK